MQHSTAQGSPGGARLPSTSTSSGAVARRATARRIASMDACRILSCRISATEAAPIAISAQRRIATAAFSRSAAVSFLESSISGETRRGTPSGNTTATATTGPASGPRPTSSTPATRPPCARSRRKCGRMINR